MDLNKEQIQQRIDAINQEMINAKARYAQLEGHLSESMHWKATIEQEEQEAEKLVTELVNESIEAAQEQSENQE